MVVRTPTPGASTNVAPSSATTAPSELAEPVIAVARPTPRPYRTVRAGYTAPEKNPNGAASTRVATARVTSATSRDLCARATKTRAEGTVSTDATSGAHRASSARAHSALHRTPRGVIFRR